MMRWGSLVGWVVGCAAEVQLASFMRWAMRLVLTERMSAGGASSKMEAFQPGVPHLVDKRPGTPHSY
jgi:hypothetical protein